MSRSSYEVFKAVVPGTANQDRAASFELPNGGQVLVLADGAGGMSGGTKAADAVVAAVSSAVAAGRRGDWASVLVEADLALANVGATTAIVAEVVGDAVDGASVGDSGAWLLRPHDTVDLTADQQRKPLVGSGRANPVRFSARLTAEDVLLIASDGLFKYAPWPDIGRVCREKHGDPAPRLVDLARLPNDQLQDDVAVIVVRRAHLR